MSLFQGIKPDGKPDAVRLDADGHLLTSGSGGGGGGDASAANQLTQIAAEEAIQAAVESIDGKTPALVSGAVPVTTTAGDVWVGERFVPVTFSSMTPSGIDLAPLIPSGMKVASIIGDITLAGTSTIYLEAHLNDAGVHMGIRQGPLYENLGRWKHIGSTTPSTAFPLWVKMTPA